MILRGFKDEFRGFICQFMLKKLRRGIIPAQLNLSFSLFKPLYRHYETHITHCTTLKIG